MIQEIRYFQTIETFVRNDETNVQQKIFKENILYMIFLRFNKKYTSRFNLRPGTAENKKEENQPCHG